MNKRQGPDEVDVLVIGAGAAGMTAALVAAAQGCDVLLCEKSSQVGGTAARSSGGIWVPGHDGEPPERARAYLDRLLPDGRGAALRDAYLDDAPRALAWLEANSAVRFAPLPHPDYLPQEGASREGRSVGALPFDGRRLGPDFDALAPPLASLVALGGMMVGRAEIPHLLHPFGSWHSLRLTLGLLGRHLKDRLRHRRGTRLLMGNALVASLFYSLKQRGVAIWRNSPATRLLQENGRVVGALVEQQGMERRVRARRAVVLAAGGFSHSPAWRERLMQGAEKQALSLAHEGCTGDGLSLAEQCGASVSREGLCHACVWSPVSVLARKGRPALMYPHLFLDRPKPGFIAVDRRGRRFTNEAGSYHDFVAGMLAADGPARDGRAWLICDSLALRSYGMGMVLPGGRNARRMRRAGYLVQGPTLAALAAKLGIDAAGLAQEVERYNEFAASGLDADFGKGSSYFNRFHGDPAHAPNACLAPISQGPFAAVELRAADLSTFAGIRTTSEAQAMDAEGHAIPGLYAVGNDMASIWQGEAPGPGVTLGPAMVFAWRAAMHIVNQEQPPCEAKMNNDAPMPTPSGDGSSATRWPTTPRPPPTASTLPSRPSRPGTSSGEPG